MAGENPSQANSLGVPPSAKFYAVKNGRVPGIYTDWPSAQEQIRGWQKPKHRCFSTRSEAQRFLEQDAAVSESSSDAPAGEDDSSAPKNLDGQHESTIHKPTRRKPKSALNGISKSRISMPEYNEEEFEAGMGPLPPGAEDGFDPNIMLDPVTGKVVYKTQEQRQATKLAPTGDTQIGPIRVYTDGSSLGNGTAGAFAGVGVYFGPSHKR